MRCPEYESQRQELIAVAVYVDDFPVIGSLSNIVAAKDRLRNSFSITDEGRISYYLGKAK